MLLNYTNLREVNQGLDPNVEQQLVQAISQHYKFRHKYRGKKWVKPYYYVYEITCSHPNRPHTRYWGYRSSYVPAVQDISYWGSSNRLNRYLKKFGLVYFEKTILAEFSTVEEATYYEAEIHEQEMVGSNPDFFNEVTQTKAKAEFNIKRRKEMSEETKAKISAKKKGQPMSPNSLANLRPPRVQSEETKAKRRATMNSPAYKAAASKRGKANWDNLPEEKKLAHSQLATENNYRRWDELFAAGKADTQLAYMAAQKKRTPEEREISRIEHEQQKAQERIARLLAGEGGSA